MKILLTLKRKWHKITKEKAENGKLRISAKPNIYRGVVARALPPPVADEGKDGAGRNTEQCEALQASSATMFLTDGVTDTAEEAS